MPLVSVVIPAYNCSRTLGKAIDSALAQDIPLEVLVLDDCGAESLAEIIEGYRVNPAVRYVKNERNLGACASRNIGVEMAKGKYVASLDADDWWEKENCKSSFSESRRQVRYCVQRRANWLLRMEGLPGE